MTNTTPVVVNDVAIRRDQFGRYSLNDLHRAAVAAGNATDSHAPSQFLRTDSVRSFIAAVDSSVQICTDEQNQQVSAVSSRPGPEANGGGTWAHELVAIRYAAWIDPAFEVRVYTVFREAVVQPTQHPMVYNDTPAETAIRVASLLCKELEFHGPVKVAMLKSALLLKAPEYVVLLPAYGQNAPRTMDGKLIGGETSTKPAFAATALLRKFKSNLTIHQFNKLVEAAGFLEVRERPSSKYDGVIRTYKAISDKGLKFGMNLAPTDRPQNIQPLWFEHTFAELLSTI